MIDLGSIADLIDHDHTLAAFWSDVLRDPQQRGLKPANVLSGRAGVGGRDFASAGPFGAPAPFEAT